MRVLVYFINMPRKKWKLRHTECFSCYKMDAGKVSSHSKLVRSSVETFTRKRYSATRLLSGFACLRHALALASYLFCRVYKYISNGDGELWFLVVGEIIT